jgi:hypothetical protein
MKHFFTLIVGIFTCMAALQAQKINGQWRGFFDSKGDISLYGDKNTEYVLELEINGSEVTGYSYSYFENRKYYVICELEGSYFAGSKSIKVVETKRIKGNTRPDFQDCFQTHYLTYEKEGDKEKLVGRWETAPGQRASCGVGSTALTRRTLSNNLAGVKPKTETKPTSKPKTETAVVTPFNKPKPKPQTKPATPPPTVKNNATAKPKPAPSLIIAPPPIAKIEKPDTELAKDNKPPVKKLEVLPSKTNPGFEKRRVDVVKTIEIKNETFTVTLYDNGEVDGDTVSVFYNNKLIVSKKRLSDKPLTLTLDANTDVAVNELTMYAENLGEIPPNTALMVVNDGEKRYEVRISSDLKNSGTIHFVHNSKTQ